MLHGFPCYGAYSLVARPILQLRLPTAQMVPLNSFLKVSAAPFFLEGPEAAQEILYGLHRVVGPSQGSHHMLPTGITLSNLISVLQGFIGDWPAAAPEAAVARTELLADAVAAAEVDDSKEAERKEWWSSLDRGSQELEAIGSEAILQQRLIDDVLNGPFKERLLNAPQGGLSTSPGGRSSLRLSEVLAVAAFAHAFRVDAILESGVYHGFSTELWIRWLSGAGGLERVVAVDKHIYPEAQKRLAPHFENASKVELLEGDGVEVLPHALDRLAKDGARAVAAVIDGPKHEKALRLAYELLSGHEHLVRFAAIHDARGFKRGPRASAWRQYGLRPLLFTDEAWFLRNFGWLDRKNSKASRTTGSDEGDIKASEIADKCSSETPSGTPSLVCAIRSVNRRAFAPPGGEGTLVIVELLKSHRRKRRKRGR
eukprot:TRINITY_DN27147_c0_g1_i1.p1 TRINITY_DN27147_c0_g1~~TRINITY_DN27147_c0_g1_i1.p1  ORF type:complete len:427 (+),score=70.05 TRINITY_DN27147_c0_g1_i1:356-1636(+)